MDLKCYLMVLIGVLRVLLYPTMSFSYFNPCIKIKDGIIIAIFL